VWPAGLAALTVNSVGWVPSDEDAARGSSNEYELPLPAVPGCGQVPLSPVTFKHTLLALTPADPEMLAETASGGPGVSKNTLPSGLAYPGGVETVRLVIWGASGKPPPSGGEKPTQTRATESQVAPDAQSRSEEQAPRLDVWQAAAATQRSAMKRVRMVRRRR